MHTMRYMDGSPVEPAYLNAVSVLVGHAAHAESVVPIDELEACSQEQRNALPSFLPYEAMTPTQRAAYDARQGIQPGDRDKVARQLERAGLEQP